MDGHGADVEMQILDSHDTDAPARDRGNAESSFTLPEAESNLLEGVVDEPPYPGFKDADPVQFNAMVTKWCAARQSFVENVGLLFRVSIKDELYVRWDGHWIRLSNACSPGGSGAVSAFGRKDNPDPTLDLDTALGLINTPLGTLVPIGLFPPVKAEFEQIDTAAQNALNGADETLVKTSMNVIANVDHTRTQPEWVQETLNTYDNPPYPDISEVGVEAYLKRQG